MAFASGKNGRVTIGGSILKVTEWEVSPKVEKLDTTNSESGGTGEYIPGVTDLDFTISFDYNVGNTPAHFSVLAPGLTVAAVLFIRDSSGPSWTISTGLVTDGEVKSSVRGKVSCRVRGCSSGGYTVPAS